MRTIWITAVGIKASNAIKPYIGALRALTENIRIAIGTKRTQSISAKPTKNAPTLALFRLKPILARLCSPRQLNPCIRRASVRVEKGNAVSEPAAPVKDGFEFEGWYKDSALTIPYDFSEKVSGNLTLYAKWSESGDTPGDSGFTDISGHWAEKDINELAKLGIIDGYGDKTYRPELGTTRAEFAKIVVTCLGLEPNENGIVYDDTKSHWAKGYIATATELGIVNGIGDNLFDPDTVITREQMAAIIYRMAGSPEDVKASAFADGSSVSEYAKSAVDYVSQNGIMIGFEDNTYRPKEHTNRAQVATVILRLIKADFFKIDNTNTAE